MMQNIMEAELEMLEAVFTPELAKIYLDGKKVEPLVRRIEYLRKLLEDE